VDKATGIEAAVMAAFLRTGKQIDLASMLLLLVAAIWTTGPLMGLALLAAGIQKYYALRVALDADLFSILARHPEQLAQFDTALALCACRPVSDRSLALRWQGARRLQVRQLVAFMIQLAVLTILLVKHLA
jgi:hypothetical protein